MNENNGTFWDQISASLQQIGLDTATKSAQAVANKITGGMTQDSQVKQDPSVVQPNPWDYGGLNSLNKVQIAGIGLPILLAGAAVLYFAVKK